MKPRNIDRQRDYERNITVNLEQKKVNKLVFTLSHIHVADQVCNLRNLNKTSDLRSLQSFRNEVKLCTHQRQIEDTKHHIRGLEDQNKCILKCPQSYAECEEGSLCFDTVQINCIKYAFHTSQYNARILSISTRTKKHWCLRAI